MKIYAFAKRVKTMFSCFPASGFMFFVAFTLLLFFLSSKEVYSNDIDDDGDGYTENQGDCNDADANEHPGQTWYKDTDNDGYSDGTTDTTSCTRPTGYKVAAELASTSGDCDDNNPNAWPDAIPDNLNNGLIAFYPFDGNANDESVNGNNGIVNGATLTEDRFGNTNSAYLFDGVNDFISVDHHDSLEPSYGLTLSVWIRNTHPLGKWGDDNVISKDAKIGDLANGYLLRTGYPEDEIIIYAGGKKPDHHNNVAGHDTNEWLHAVGTYTAGSQIALYVNGELMTADTGGVPSFIPYTHGQLRIGSAFDGSSFFYKGMIDDIRIYNRALSDSEVQELYSFTGSIEVCDGVDNNCNGQVDEGVTTTHYEDADQDGYGNPDFGVEGCPPPAGYVTDNTDCDDSDPNVNPGAVEVFDGVDNNCNGLVDEADRYYWLEAESADSITSPMQVANDGAASGGQYIWAPNGQGNNLDGTGGYAEYTVNITNEGEYVLWGRVIALNKSSSNDSFFAKVGSSANEAWSVARVSSWQWDKVNIMSGVDPVKYYLTTGENKIKIGQREDGTKLDKLLLTNDMNYVPTGTGGNSPPAANDDTDTTSEDTPVTINVVGNDTDADGTINPATVVIVNNPVNGTAVHNGDGTVTYSPYTGYTGVDKFTYTVKDDLGATSNEAAVTVTVNGVVSNQSPTAVDDSDNTTEEDTPVTINVVGNDTDADGTINPATVVIVNNPVNGTAVHNGDGTVTYSPYTGYTGIDTFTYTVEDDLGATSNEATVTVNITSISDPNRYYWLEAESADSITSPMQVANDGAASGGQYIWAPNGQGNNWDGTGGYAEYPVNVTKEGEYILWGRVIAPTSSDDSFFVEVGLSANKAWSVARVSSWQWDKVNIKGGADPVKYYLTTGEHKIKIGQREDGTKLDKLLLTNDMNYVPTGTGGN